MIPSKISSLLNFELSRFYYICLIDIILTFNILAVCHKSVSCFVCLKAVQIIEANEAMKSRLRNLDAVHAERDELIQQLETAKKELFHEQKKARTTIEELKEVTSQY